MHRIYDRGDPTNFNPFVSHHSSVPSAASPPSQPCSHIHTFSSNHRLMELFTDCLSRLPFSTAYIECFGVTADGTIISCNGTSFFYIKTGPRVSSAWGTFNEYPENSECPQFNSMVDPDHFVERVVKGKNRLFVITNLHVYNGLSKFVTTTRVQLRLKLYESDLNDMTSDLIPMDVADMTIVHHPNGNVDLIGFDITDVITAHKEKGKNLLYFAFTKQSLMTQEKFSLLTVYEDVAMVGYPNGVYDETNNLPVVRGGKIATIPRMDYLGQPLFVIDCACMQGSSASPVLLVSKPEPIVDREHVEYVTSAEITNNHEGGLIEDELDRDHSVCCDTSLLSFVKDVDFDVKRQIYFLGVMSSGPMSNVDDHAKWITLLSPR